MLFSVEFVSESTSEIIQSLMYKYCRVWLSVFSWLCIIKIESPLGLYDNHLWDISIILSKLVLFLTVVELIDRYNADNKFNCQWNLKEGEQFETDSSIAMQLGFT